MVSILVLVEVALEVTAGEISKLSNAVSILVLVEVALEDLSDYRLK